MLGTQGNRRAYGARNGFKIRGAACASLLALSAPTSALPAMAGSEASQGPAMWALSDEDTTIFLFGTFHALDRDTGWFNDLVRAAFERSDQLVLETVVPSDPAELLDSLNRHSLAAPAKAGEPVVANKGPGFVESTRETMSAGHSVGMSVDHGADAVLRRAARSSGKPVEGLESFDFQLSMFSSLPAPKRSSAAAPSQGMVAAQMQDMKSAWKRGDSAHFAAVLGNVERQSPETYRRLFADRNARWAEWVARRMERPGVVFVAVGTGHLIGRDSLQQRLNERGYSAFRIG